MWGGAKLEDESDSRTAPLTLRKPGVFLPTGELMELLMEQGRRITRARN